MAHYTLTIFDIDSERKGRNGVRPLEKVTVWDAVRHYASRPVTDLTISTNR